ncbi:MAG: type III-A CRISPR-associated RAMP protein Csm3 [Endomicrobiaceae bacterium]|nr:type III-A CRISPR-associated RAMP protein Csm3 [Endomicrobiaceae bacterium]
MKLVAIRKITGTIKLKSDLHIGMGYTEMRIGETYSSVIKNSHTLQPYIPGSSIKGTIRSLLELSLGLIKYTDGAFVKAETLSKITNEEDRKNAEIILKLFGCGVGNDNDEVLAQIGPSRTSFFDSCISKKWLEEHNNYVLTEIKSENSRFFEVVSKGVGFDFVIAIKEFENDDFVALFELLKKGLKLLESNSLGGNGSRGYGRIEFLNLSLDSQTISLTDVSF